MVGDGRGHPRGCPRLDREEPRARPGRDRVGRARPVRPGPAVLRGLRCHRHGP
ncbi:hypothetical protein G5V59_00450 [Nocardioides sp. W3-2-3]|nr:hypothetical protein [Nocardioides convexus]